ncbi:MAG TPA: LysE family translocator [Chitinophagaceae bacterium]|nr:LysE family translocator [Chitinophagaceae bacterium]
MPAHTPSITLFISAAILLNLTPGPDMLYVATRTASQGLKAGILSAFGIFSGTLVHISFAIFGLSIILQRSAAAFMTLKYAGAAYLIYLGIIALIKKDPSALDNGPAQKQRYRKVYLQSILTNVLNPKVALFFLAFLPQFIDPAQGHIPLHILGLGLYFDIQGTLILMGVAIGITRLGQGFLQKSRALPRSRKLTGGILIALGIRLALLDKK